jgi:glutathione synthase
MDPIERVRVGHDTTFALMLEVRRRGLELRCFEQRDLSWRNGQPRARMRALEVRPEAGRHFEVLADRPAHLSELDVLFLRKDPPVDVLFLHSSQLVEMVPQGQTLPLFVNSPAGLRLANEKLFALRFPEFIPSSLVSSNVEEIIDFVAEVGGRAVLKPLDGCGGHGVLLANKDDPSLGSLVEVITARGVNPIMVQRFLPAVEHGDKRVLMLDGEPIGAVLRVARKGDFRCNMAVGGQPRKTTLTPRERSLCGSVGEELRRQSLHFVGLDLIGEHLTEVNVTSPTGLVEIEAFDGAGLAAKVLDFVLARRRGELRAR